MKIIIAQMSGIGAMIFLCLIYQQTESTQTAKAEAFSKEIRENVMGNFERETDKMCHVSTFCYADDKIYVSYYANTSSDKENPDLQTARLAYAPVDDMNNKTVIDIMSVGDDLLSHKVLKVYDTILMQKNDEPKNIYVLWTAFIDDQYYRLYRIFNIKSEKMGDVKVNRFKVCATVNDFSTAGIKNALSFNGIGYKEMRSDIGIMQKLTTRTENLRRKCCRNIFNKVESQSQKKKLKKFYRCSETSQIITMNGRT